MQIKYSLVLYVKLATTNLLKSFWEARQCLISCFAINNNYFEEGWERYLSLLKMIDFNMYLIWMNWKKYFFTPIFINTIKEDKLKEILNLFSETILLNGCQFCEEKIKMSMNKMLNSVNKLCKKKYSLYKNTVFSNCKIDII